MKEYSCEDWGISRSEYNRLVEAVEQGILLDFTVEGRRYELKNGYPDYVILENEKVEMENILGFQ